jgi:cell division protein FtsX
MKKMPTINALALGSIRARKRQYVTLVTGIMLAIFFTSSMLLVGQSLNHTYQEHYFRQVGKQDAVLLNAEGVLPEEWLDSGYVTNTGNVYIIGVTEGKETSIAYYDEAGEALAYKQCVQGRMPEAVGEIAIERSQLQRLRMDTQLGDTLTLPIKVPNGNGFLPKMVNKTYTLVGILAEQTTYQRDGKYLSSEDRYYGYPGAVVCRAEQVEPGGRPIINLLVQLSPLQFNTTAAMTIHYGQHDFCVDHYGFNLFLNTTDSNSSMLGIMVVSLGLVLVGVACMGIAGAFSMMLSERRSQIGMLRAVGATRRQIRRIFGREALVIALAVAPAAIALSHFAVWGLSKAIGEGLQYYASSWFLPLEFLLSIAFVMVAAYLPLFEASRTSPMQAIRETSLLRARKRMRIREKKAFWPPSLLAWRHLKLYRAKQVGIWTVSALSLVVLAMGFNAAWNILSPVHDEYDFQINASIYQAAGFVEENALEPLITDGDLQEAAALPLVGSIQASKAVMVNLLLKNVSEYLTGDDVPAFRYGYLKNDKQPGEGWEFWLEDDRKRYLTLKERLNIGSELVSEQISALSPGLIGQLKPYVLSGEIDIQALNDGREVLVIAPDKMYIHFDKDASGRVNGSSSGSKPEKGKRIDKVLANDMFRPGDTLALCRLYMEGERTGQESESEYDYAVIHRKDRTVRIGAVLSDQIPPDASEHIRSGERGSLITTVAGLDAMGFETSGYKNLSVKLTDTPDEQTESYLETVMSDIANRADEMRFYSAFASARSRQKWNTMVIVSNLAILILFFALSVSMVNNAVTGRIRSDKRAIGTLRAVGAPLRVIISSYLRQVAIMLGWGLVAGVLIGSGFLVYEAYEGILPEGVLLPLAGIMALYILLILLFCGFNLRARIRGIVRSSIIDNIREL